MRAFVADYISKEEVHIIGKLKDYCTMQYGYTATATYEPVGSKFLRITDIAQRQIDWSSVPYCSLSEENHSKYVLSKGDIVVARTGATVGVAKMIGNHIPDAVFASFLVRIRPIAPKYKYYFGICITSPNFLEYVRNNAGGSAQPQANPPLLGEYELIIPGKHLLRKLNIIISSFFDTIEQNEIEITKLMETKNTMVDMLSSN